MTARYPRQLRVGLQSKAILVLAVVAISVMAVGGWFYFATTRSLVRKTDHSHAARLCQTLVLAAQEDLADGHGAGLQRIVNDFIRKDNVSYIALLDDAGKIIATASRDAGHGRWTELVKMPVALSMARQVGDDLLVVARPIVKTDAASGKRRILGAARLAMDTSATTGNLIAAQRRLGIIAAVVVLCTIPLGYLLVWRVMVQPIRRLLAATRRLGSGDFAARSGLKRTDEIGELGAAFDKMAERIRETRRQLILANEGLEHKVAERTEELQILNQHLREEMAEKEDFLRAVSHDLNAPLRNIAGMATMMLMKWQKKLPEQVVTKLQRVQANVEAETSLISELLELSQIKTRTQKRRLVDMGKLLADLAGTFEFELKSRNIALQIDRNMPQLHLEKNRIRQVFQNLIDNAIKYMDRPAGGRIEVGYRFAEGMHLFSVADNGPGIPPNEQQEIFYIFRRAQNVATSKVQGKGVGLALVKGIAANYGGKAYVQSQIGRGSTFYVTLADRYTQDPRGRPVAHRNPRHEAAPTATVSSRPA